MADFSLNNTGEIELAQFGETTLDEFWEICYPELEALLRSDEVRDAGDELTPQGRVRVREAVEHERRRLWGNQPSDEPSTELGKEIAKQMGTSAVVADHYVKRRAREILKSASLSKRKPN